jgi:uncharacterized protein (DUF1778 family)
VPAADARLILAATRFSRSTEVTFAVRECLAGGYFIACSCYLDKTVLVDMYGIERTFMETLGSADMFAFRSDDETSGQKTARMEQRTTEQIKSLIERAAGLLGVNASEFTVAAAAKAARETLRDFETTSVRPEDHAAFLRALDDAEPTNDLIALMKLHAESKASR